MLQVPIFHCLNKMLCHDDRRPQTPTQEECCGNGCDPCIFDIHKKLLDEWNKKKSIQSNLLSNKNFLSPLRYSKFIVKDIAKASEDCIFIQLDCVSDKDNIIFLSPCQHVILRFVSTSKPYTPISWNSKSLRLLIKLYPNGKASSCVKRLKIEDELFVRGPYGEFNYKRNSYKHILMFSIGSGIAALYPLANSIVKDELENTKIDLLVGFHSLCHVPLINELRLLTDYWNFECTLYLSQTSSENISGLQIVHSRLNEKIFNEILSNHVPESSLVLICGTPEFNDFSEKILIKKKFLHYHIFK